jgi:hypothetical protein
MRSRDDGDFGISESLFPLSVCLRVQKDTERLRTALPSTLQSGFGPLRLPLVWAHARSPERPSLRD